MKNIVLFLFTFPLFLFSQNKKEKLDNKELFVMFYNVENLFDTIDNPHTNDNEFLPNSNKSWNSNKYNYKLKQLERVFASLAKNENNDKMPDIIVDNQGHIINGHHRYDALRLLGVPTAKVSMIGGNLKEIMDLMKR